MRKILLIIYYLVGKQLPSSFFPGGNIFNSFRIFLLKKLFKIGDKCKVQSGVYIGNGTDIIIGDYCQINENVKMDNVLIGSYVMVAPGVTFLGKMHAFSSINTPMILQGEETVNPTIIEDDVWIGTSAIIMPGLKIARGSIIGAGCVLTKSTEPYSIYGGVPGKKIGCRK